MKENQQIHLKILPFLELQLVEPCELQNKYISTIQRNKVRTRLWGEKLGKLYTGIIFKTLNKEVEQQIEVELLSTTSIQSQIKTDLTNQMTDLEKSPRMQHEELTMEIW